MANSSRLLPFSHNESRPTYELALSTVNTRKRDYSTSDSFLEPASTDVDSDLGIDYNRPNSHKRLLQFMSSDAGDEYVARAFPPSSPPRDESDAFSNTNTSMLSSTTAVGSFRMGSLTSRSLSARSSSFVYIDENSQRAIEVIRQCLDEGKGNVELDDLGIKEIPEEISDLRNMVSLIPGFNGNDTGPLRPTIKLFLSNNCITQIPPSLFTVDNITVLSLRNNNLTSIPSSISRLKNLQNLSLAGNQLTSLPSQILDLKDLQVLLLHPNPFYSLPDEAKVVRPESASSAYLAYSRTSEQLSPAPSKLSESCLRSLATYKATGREIERWNLPQYLLDLVKLAVSMHAYGNTCGNCSSFMVKEASYSLEWWNGVAGQNDVVVKRKFCSGNCMAAWKMGL